MRAFEATPRRGGHEQRISVQRTVGQTAKAMLTRYEPTTPEGEIAIFAGKQPEYGGMSVAHPRAGSAL
jgi:hypothetical protein